MEVLAPSKETLWKLGSQQGFQFSGLLVLRQDYAGPDTDRIYRNRKIENFPDRLNCDKSV